MRVKMKVGISGARNGQDWPRVGGEVDLPDDEAATLCAADMATPVPDDGVETAVPSEEDVEIRSDDDASDVDALREQAAAAGVKVDKRWGVDKLRAEITSASSGKSDG